MKILQFQLLSTLVNCCCLALLDACVPLSTVFSAITCGYTENGQLVTDLSAQQEEVGIDHFVLFLCINFSV